MLNIRSYSVFVTICYSELFVIRNYSSFGTIHYLELFVIQYLELFGIQNYSVIRTISYSVSVATRSQIFQKMDIHHHLKKRCKNEREKANPVSQFIYGNMLSRSRQKFWRLKNIFMLKTSTNSTLYFNGSPQSSILNKESIKSSL